MRVIHNHACSWSASFGVRRCRAVAGHQPRSASAPMRCHV